MHKANYQYIAAFEKDNWWYRARRDLLDRLIRSSGRRFRNALDAGCGVGSNFAVISRYSDAVTGVDNAPEAICYCFAKGYRALHEIGLNDYASTDRYDLIVCADVLEHIPDATATVKNLTDHLDDNGILIVTVPAHNHLWNDNDVFSRHVKRYEYEELKQLLTHGDLVILKLSFWNLSLYLPSLALYALRRACNKHELQNNLSLVPPFLNGILYALLRAENVFLQRFSLFEGVSLFAVCQKRNARRTGTV